MPVVPYLMDLAMGVVNAVVAVVLGSRVPSPPFACDCLAMAAAWAGSVFDAIIFCRHVSAHLLIRLVKGPDQSKGVSKSVSGLVWWYMSAGRRWGALARMHLTISWRMVCLSPRWLKTATSAASSMMSAWSERHFVLNPVLPRGNPR
eukprot:scaffold233117_cov42-Attheya_sp.AAC.1